jgi:protein-tyrosine phosphatase
MSRIGPNTVGYVDLHSHVLPGLDDGSTDLDTSMNMLRGLAGLGYERVTATPHQKASQFLPAREQIAAAYAQTQAAVAAANLPLALSLAAENYWDHVFFERSLDGSFPRYDGGKAFLFEVSPEDLPARFEDTLFQLALRGHFPVLAHPERYRPFWDDLPRLQRLGMRCALVVDLGALAGHHGAKQAKMARLLVSERIAHAAASDVHSPSDIKDAAEGIEWIRKKCGPAAVRRLLEDNPRQILAAELPDP